MKNNFPFFLAGTALLLVSSFAIAEIYQWTDEYGKTHYSDKKLNNKVTKDVSAKYDVKDPFKIDIESRGYRIALKTKGVIRSSVLKMGEILSDKLGVKYKSGAHIKVIIFSNKNDYAAYGGKKQSSGYYSLKNKEAVIRKSRTTDKTLETIVHETSHLLLAFNYGRTPRWLNEGLAEYFESMKLAFSSIEIPTKQRWIKKIKSHLRDGSLLTIKKYISQTPKQWVLANNAKDNLGYAYGWSLVSFLMSSEEGRKTLRELFAGLKKGKHSKDYSVKSISHSYAGGIDALEKDWRKWIYIKKTSTFY